MTKYILFLSLVSFFVPAVASSIESNHVEIQDVSFRYFCRDNKYYDYYATFPTFMISQDFYEFHVAPTPNYDLLKREGILVVTDKNKKEVLLGRLDLASLCMGRVALSDSTVHLELKQIFKMEAFLSYDGKCDYGTWTQGEGKYVTGWAIGDIKQVLTLKNKNDFFWFENNRYMRVPLNIYKSKEACSKAGEAVVRGFPIR